MISQKALILDYLKKGHGLTQSEAAAKFGCYKLATRISELRSEHNILSTWEYGTNRLGNESKWVRYTYIGQLSL